MRQRRWIKFLKDYNFGLNYHPYKSNAVVDALSRNSLHMSMLMVRELDLIEQSIDLSLWYERTPNNVKLGMLKLTSGVPSSIGMEPFKDLYGRRYGTHLCWYDFGESVVF